MAQTRTITQFTHLNAENVAVTEFPNGTVREEVNGITISFGKTTILIPWSQIIEVWYITETKHDFKNAM